VLLAVIVAAFLLLTAVRLTGPHDLMDRDQQKAAGYVKDVLHNGHWASQRDVDGMVMSKPPMFTWLAAGAVAMSGGMNRFALAVPSAVSVLLVVLLLYWAGDRWFGRWAGFWAAVMYLPTIPVYKQLGLIRTDPLLTLTVTAGMLTAFLAWTRRLSWLWFWLVVTASILTKGPLGPALAAFGLAAAAWERLGRAPAGEDPPRPAPVSGHAAGILLTLAITGAWFWFAWLRDGQDFIDKVIGQELVGHAVGDEDRGLSLRAVRPFFFFLSRFFPWSIPACVAIWRVVRHPASDPQVRRFERFLVCQFALGTLLFCLGSHKREDHIFPLLPAAAWLAGREFVRWWPPKRPARYVAVIAAGLAVLAGIHAVVEHTVRVTKPQNVSTRAARAFARDMDRAVGREFPFAYAMFTPYAPQYFLRTYRPNLLPAQLPRLLGGDVPVFVVAPYDPPTPDGADALHELARSAPMMDGALRVVSNHPRLEWPPVVATLAYDLHLQLENAALVSAHAQLVVVRRRDPAKPARVTVTNWDTEPRRVNVRLAGTPDTSLELAPEESAAVATQR
jgi:4-amino-4-deoxy-L-arabinose transferase-like glycosyltransferase